MPKTAWAAGELRDLPAPVDLAAHPRVLLAEFERLVGTSSAALACAALLGGADPAHCREVLAYLAGRPAADILAGRWPSYCCRVWGARGLRYVWLDATSPAVVAGLTDESWRVAEMCLKVSTLRGLGEAGPGAETLLHHELPRVRAAAVRCLGAVGDTEHVDGVLEFCFDAEQTVRRVADRALDAMALRLDLDVDTLER